jgi:hypothetical protein
MENIHCWGPIHWLSGIKEYVVDRCLCSANNEFIQDDENRGYVEKNITTDCCCLFPNAIHKTNSDDDSDDSDDSHKKVKIPDELDNQPEMKTGSMCDDPFMGTLCCPCAMISHLICLPFMCCFCNKESWDKSRIAKYKLFWILVACDIDSIEEMEEINKDIAISRREAIEKDFADYPKLDDDDETFKRKLKNVGKTKNYDNFAKIEKEHYANQIKYMERSSEMTRNHNSIMNQNRQFEQMRNDSAIRQQQHYHSIHRY